MKGSLREAPGYKEPIRPGHPSAGGGATCIRKNPEAELPPSVEPGHAGSYRQQQAGEAPPPPQAWGLGSKTSPPQLQPQSLPAAPPLPRKPRWPPTPLGATGYLASCSTACNTPAPAPSRPFPRAPSHPRAAPAAKPSCSGLGLGIGARAWGSVYWSCLALPRSPLLGRPKGDSSGASFWHQSSLSELEPHRLSPRTGPLESLTRF